ncbi:MAG: Nuclear protein SET [Parcubacteria group bacterium GW2011_GWA2_56_21]|nr:MAG: Nuclear protein SET [Parcubacteria group bacterium GW2011_GWA2_56_21]
MKKIYIGKSRIDGKGIFAGEFIPKGKLIQYISGTKVKKLPKTKEDSLSIPTWFGLGRSYWMDPGNGSFRYLNHSCDPSAAVSGTKSLVALRDIPQNEEITFDYSMTDADPLWEMACSCKAKNCRGTIHSIQFVSPDIFKKHMPHVPRYFQRLYLRTYVSGKVKSKNHAG